MEPDEGEKDELGGRDGRGGLRRQAMLIDSLYNMTEFFFFSLSPGSPEGGDWLERWLAGGTEYIHCST